ncbi:glycosyltransferase family 2 protein [Methanobacterium bryantii]|uniref:Glycosyltransferase 2-like domain-containing protein n=1 Tax=Methanobacterium bryantii TaxID=2161 RepID=A0A2A2HAG0_METBR|nr:glycosyltransferase family 2 protein [Methanobacterium bryantii]PAV06306.1 hypothetical protein ASJ80_15895 [Methanobacterium bryantii]
MNYRISIIVPVFNVENHIRNALESILRQSIGFKRLEVIMVNDYSTDKSREIMDEYADKYDNFTAIHLHENSAAAGKPRNIGMRKATADYIMFLDPDDYYTDNACEVLYNKIVAEDADIVFGNYFNFRKGKLLKVKTPFNMENEIKVNRIQEETRLLAITPSIWTKIFKTTFIKENNILFPEGIPGQDLVFVVNSLLNAKRIIFLNKFIVCNRNLRDSGSDRSITYTQNKKYLIGLIDTYTQLYHIFKQNNHEDYIQLGFHSHISFWMRQFMLYDLNQTEKRELLSTAAPLFKKLQFNGLTFKQKQMEVLFNSISNKKYDEALILGEVIHLSIEKENKLKRKLKSKQKQVATLQTVKGWSLYKSKNILQRLKNKFKK